MKLGRLSRHLGLAAVAWLVVAACGSTSNNTSASCSESIATSATSASSCGGMDALVAAAKAEGKLNIIATPPDWANYGASIDAFQAKYGIKVTSANPNGGSQDEIDAVKSLAGTSSAPNPTGRKRRTSWPTTPPMIPTSWPTCSWTRKRGPSPSSSRG